jgi:hypothetical protein
MSEQRSATSENEVVVAKIKVTGADNLKETEKRNAQGDLIRGVTGDLTVAIEENGQEVFSTTIPVDNVASTDDAKYIAIFNAKSSLEDLAKCCAAELARR